MNERIQELAEQAGSTHKQNLGVYQFYTDELQKFAELIVRECVTAMNEMPRYAHTPITKDIENATIEDCISTVKNHFGVEE